MKTMFGIFDVSFTKWLGGPCTPMGTVPCAGVTRQNSLVESANRRTEGLQLWVRGA